MVFIKYECSQAPIPSGSCFFRTALIEFTPEQTVSSVFIGQQQAMVNSLVPLETRKTVILARNNASTCLFSS